MVVATTGIRSILQPRRTSGRLYQLVSWLTAQTPGACLPDRRTCRGFRGFFGTGSPPTVAGSASDLAVSCRDPAAPCSQLRERVCATPIRRKENDEIKSLSRRQANERPEQASIVCLMEHTRVPAADCCSQPVTTIIVLMQGATFTFHSRSPKPLQQASGRRQGATVPFFEPKHLFSIRLGPLSIDRSQPQMIWILDKIRDGL